MTISRVVDGCRPLERAQASGYLHFLEEEGRARSVRRGRNKVWCRPLPTDKAHSQLLARAIGARFGLATAEALKGTPFHEAAERVTSELHSAVPLDRVQMVDAVVKAFVCRRQSEPRDPTTFTEVLEELLTALQYGKRVKFKYTRASDGKTDVYDVSPRGLVLYHDNLYLLAHKDGDRHRTFDLEGISDCQRSRAGGRPPPADYSLRTAFASSFGFHTDYPPEHVELTVSGHWARVLGRRLLHPSQSVTPTGPNQVRVTFDVGLCPELRAWIRGLVPHVTIHAPATLRDAIASELQAWLQNLTTPS